MNPAEAGRRDRWAACPRSGWRRKRRERISRRKKFFQQHPGAVSVVAPANGKVTLAPGQACAVPLSNVMPRGKLAPEPAPMPAPAPEGNFPIKEVPLPAPSCDDVKE